MTLAPGEIRLKGDKVASAGFGGCGEEMAMTLMRMGTAEVQGGLSGCQGRKEEEEEEKKDQHQVGKGEKME